MEQLNELRERLGKIDLRSAADEYLLNNAGQATYNPAAFDENNIYNANCGFWRSADIKKPSLLELEKYYKIYLERQKKIEADKCWKELKEERNKILDKTDWTQISDVPLTSHERTIYREYRKYVRNKDNDYKDDTVHKWKIITFEEFRQMKFPK